MIRRNSTFARFALTAVLLTAMMTASPLIASPDSFWPTTPDRLQHVGAVQGTLAKQSNLEIGIVNAETGAPIRAIGTHRVGKMNGDVSDQRVLQFIDSHQDRFGISSSELDILHSGDVLGKYYFTARQTIDSRPVLGTTVLLRIRSNGNISMYGADVVRDQRNRSFGAGLGLEQAAEALAAFAEVTYDRIVFSQQVWVRIQGELYPAWQLTLEGENLLERPHGLVSVESGEVLGYYNDVQEADVSGNITGPIYLVRFQDDIRRAHFPFQTIVVGGTDLVTDEGGAFSLGGFTDNATVDIQMRLAGQWVTVVNEDQADAAFDTSVVAPFDEALNWRSPEHGRMDEFNVYYHTNFIHEFYKVLDADFSGLDYPVLATVGVGDHFDNAYWAGDQMAFGTGAQMNNLALFSDVIYHEYTHGVTGSIYPPGMLPYSGQSGAMNEAWSDYFPCSIHNNPAVAPGIYRSNDLAPLRDLNNNRSYPENFVGEVHTDGLILGGALWDLRQIIGDPTFVDSLIHFARYGLAEDFQSYFLEVLEADDDNGDISDGTPHAEEIYDAFGEHGIGPGEEPNIVVSSLEILEAVQDNVLQPGEMVDIHITLFNDVFLYPPAATNVQVVATAGDGIVWSRNEDGLTSLGPGEETSLPLGLTFQVAEDVTPSYDWIRLDITANDGQYLFQDSIRVVLGVPEILLVNDGGATDYTSYLAWSLYEIDVGAKEQNVHESPITSERLASYPYVIWFTGDAASPISLEEATLLVEYVEAGGHLILSGQHIGPQLMYRESLKTILGVYDYLPNLEEYGGLGVDGEPMSEGKTFVIVGGAGASNQDVIGGITITEGTQGLYNYFYSSVCAVSYRTHLSGGSAAFFTFGLEAVSGVSTSSSAGDILLPVLQEMGLQVSVPEPGGQEAVPLDFDLETPYPNPFNPETTVAFTLPENSRITLSVFNVLGREVMRAVDGERSAGHHLVRLNMHEFGSGIYFIRLKSDQGTLMKRAVLMK